jgi:hypothetical protein
MSILMGGAEYAAENPSTPTTRRRTKLHPKLVSVTVENCAVLPVEKCAV